MKLSEYAALHNIGYRAAWNRFKAGKIDGAVLDETGHVFIPSDTDKLRDKAVVYARVSSAKQRDDLKRQAQRLREFAVSRGYEVVLVVEEVASGVKDDRKKLTRVLRHSDSWGVLIVEHADRLTRVGFGWFQTFLGLLDKEILVADATESVDGRREDIFDLLYCFAASEYGRRGAEHRAERAQRALDAET